VVDEEIVHIHSLQPQGVHLRLELMVNLDQVELQPVSVRTVQGLDPQLKVGQTVQLAEVMQTQCLLPVLFVQEVLEEADRVRGNRVFKVKAVAAVGG
jgi:hypothetical protein